MQPITSIVDHLRSVFGGLVHCSRGSLCASIGHDSELSDPFTCNSLSSAAGQTKLSMQAFMHYEPHMSSRQ